MILGHIVYRGLPSRNQDVHNSWTVDLAPHPGRNPDASATCRDCRTAFCHAYRPRRMRTVDLFGRPNPRSNPEILPTSASSLRNLRYVRLSRPPWRDERLRSSHRTTSGRITRRPSTPRSMRRASRGDRTFRARTGDDRRVAPDRSTASPPHRCHRNRGHHQMNDRLYLVSRSSSARFNGRSSALSALPTSSPLLTYATPPTKTAQGVWNSPCDSVNSDARPHRSPSWPAAT